MANTVQQASPGRNDDIEKRNPIAHCCLRIESQGAYTFNLTVNLLNKKYCVLRTSTCTLPLQIASRSLSRDPTNGSVPVSRTCSNTPADQTSPGFPYCLRWITSGAMKCGHPTRPARPRMPSDTRFKTAYAFSKLQASQSVIASEVRSRSFTHSAKTFRTISEIFPLTFESLIFPTNFFFFNLRRSLRFPANFILSAINFTSFFFYY